MTEAAAQSCSQCGSDKFLNRLIDSRPDNPAGYYYRAVSIFKGKRPRIASLPVVREAERFLTTALELDPANGRYGITLAAIRRDYYFINGLRVPALGPDALVATAAGKHLDRLKIDQVLSLLNVPAGPVR